MRIGIDARLFGSAYQGLGRYTENLILNLARVTTTDIFYLFVLPTTVVPDLPVNFHCVRTDITWYTLREQLAFPALLNRYKFDLMHFTHFNVPLLYRRPFVVTIHDLILRHYPSAHISTRNPFFFYMKYAAYRLVLLNAIHASKKIITVSEYTRHDIETIYPHAHGKIERIYEGVSLAAKKDTNDTIVTANELHLPEKFILYVGNAYPHKNLEFLALHFDRWRKENNSYFLVFVGNNDFFYDRLKAFVAREHIGNMLFFGQTSDRDLRTIYSSATAYVFPSLCEGFGLPGLEAMSAGTPVVASSASALPEIFGAAALYFDPHDGDSLYGTLNVITRDRALRSQLRKAGIRHAQKYSWEAMSLKTNELYHSLKY